MPSKVRSFEEEFSFERSMMPYWQSVLASIFITLPSEYDDKVLAIDMRVSFATVQIRTRRYEELLDANGRQRTDFTATTGIGKDKEHEYVKLMRSNVTHFAYGFATENKDGLARWFIGDLDRLREHQARRHLKGESVGKLVGPTKYGETFISFEPESIPGFIIAASWLPVDDWKPPRTGFRIIGRKGSVKTNTRPSPKTENRQLSKPRCPKCKSSSEVYFANGHFHCGRSSCMTMVD
jgi:hypothetical protein